MLGKNPAFRGPGNGRELAGGPGAVSTDSSAHKLGGAERKDEAPGTSAVGPALCVLPRCVGENEDPAPVLRQLTSTEASTATLLQDEATLEKCH